VPGDRHSWSADVEVWRGPQYVSEAFLWDEGTTTSNAETVTLDDEYLWCSSEALGTFRLGPSRIEVFDYSGGPDGRFTDDTTGTFTVNQDATANALRQAGRAAPRRAAADRRAVLQRSSQPMDTVGQ
jgi:hypothetical protein